MPTSTAFENIRIVLSRPSHPGNIGAAARAMKTMGFASLVLVQPRRFPDPEAAAMAAGADDILAAARVVDTLEEALADCSLAGGLSARRRDLSHPASALRDAVPGLLEAAASQPVALVFGNETSGLSNEELARCQRLVSIPANPAYSSLNLAASVQIACYELAVASGGFEVVAARSRMAATGDDVEGFFTHLEATAVESGFLDPANPGRFMERMRRLYARAGLEREEVKLLRGLLWRLTAKR